MLEYERLKRDSDQLELMKRKTPHVRIYYEYRSYEVISGESSVLAELSEMVSRINDEMKELAHRLYQANIELEKKKSWW